jgi:hypothetical protein
MRTDSAGEIMTIASRGESPQTRRARLAALLAVVVAGCGAEGAPSTAAPEVTLQAIVIGGRPYAAVGVPHRLTVTGQYSNGITAALTSGVAWESADAAVATVDPTTGLVAPWASGTARITARHEATGLSATVDLTARAVTAVAAGGVLPAAGSVDTTESYFRVSGLSPGRIYKPALLGMTDDVDIAVYGDASMAPEAMLCSSQGIGLVDDWCLAPATGSGELWIVADGQWTRAGATFALDVPTAPPMELAGTLAHPAGLPYSGSVGVARQYYKVTGLTPGLRYSVGIGGLSADIDLEVYADQYDYGSLCESYLDGTVDDSCSAPANGAGELFIEIDGMTTRSGGAFTLSVTPT